MLFQSKRAPQEGVYRSGRDQKVVCLLVLHRPCKHASQQGNGKQQRVKICDVVDPESCPGHHLTKLRARVTSLMMVYHVMRAPEPLVGGDGNKHVAVVAQSRVCLL